MVARIRIVAVYVLHRLCADPDARLVLQLQRNALRVDVDANARIAAALCVALLIWLGVAHAGVLLRRQAEASRAGHADQALVGALLEHATVMGASFVGGLGLVDLHLLDPAEGVLGSRVAAPSTLGAWYQVLSSS